MSGCTAWKFDPSNECGAPAVVRRGVRCKNGCIGEGAFDFACVEHESGLRSSDLYGCPTCRTASLEWFPVSVVAS